MRTLLCLVLDLGYKFGFSSLNNSLFSTLEVLSSNEESVIHGKHSEGDRDMKIELDNTALC